MSSGDLVHMLPKYEEAQAARNLGLFSYGESCLSLRGLTRCKVLSIPWKTDKEDLFCAFEARRSRKPKFNYYIKDQT